MIRFRIIGCKTVCYFRFFLNFFWSFLFWSEKKTVQVNVSLFGFRSRWVYFGFSITLQNLFTHTWISTSKWFWLSFSSFNFFLIEISSLRWISFWLMYGENGCMASLIMLSHKEIGSTMTIYFLIFQRLWLCVSQINSSLVYMNASFSIFYDDIWSLTLDYFFWAEPYSLFNFLSVISNKISFLN